MARRRLIAGNWKMNGLARDGRALAETVARGVAALAERDPADALVRFHLARLATGGGTIIDLA